MPGPKTKKTIAAPPSTSPAPRHIADLNVFSIATLNRRVTPP